MPEADLYPPVKAHLEACGYVIRGEVGDCDIVGWDETHGTLLAVELKRGFGLPVLYQALRRLVAVDLAYVAVATPDGARARLNWQAQLPEACRLCRMLGLGLLSVRNGEVVVHADPGPFTPRRLAARRARLLGEFHRRSGDHNVGGTTRRPRMTAYREDALRCAMLLAGAGGSLRPATLRELSGVAKVGTMLRRNVYGWFEKTGHGRYALATAGAAALLQYADVVTAQAGSATGSAAGSAASPATRWAAGSTAGPATGSAAGSTAGSSAPPLRKARERPAPPPEPGNRPDSPPAAPAS